MRPLNRHELNISTSTGIFHELSESETETQINAIASAKESKCPAVSLPRGPQRPKTLVSCGQHQNQ